MLATWISAPAPANDEPVRLATTAFGVSAEVEVRDLPRAEADAAARAALEEIFEISQLVDPSLELPRGVGGLNAAAGRGPQAVDTRVAELLMQSYRICVWTDGAHGPLGGNLYGLWNRDADGLPDPGRLRAAVNSAECSRMTLSMQDGSTRDGSTQNGTMASIPAGSRVDLRWVARGYAVDRALAKLRDLGVTNAWIEIGPVCRALGGGPDGNGWLVALPPAPGAHEPLDQLWLGDQALAIVTSAPGKERPLVDQRTGVPARGVLTVVAVTESALEAEALAASLFILGLRDGQMRLGAFRPRPSVYWLLGEGDGKPLESAYRWSELDRVSRRQN